jgi:hypothetical protein
MARDAGEAVKKYALQGRSPLYRWMHDKYAELRPVLTKPRPSWTAVAQAAYDDGLKGRDGNPYPRQVAWKTWKLLSRDMEGSDPAPRTVKPPPAGPTQDRQPPAAPASVPADLPGDDNPYGFRFAGEWKPKNAN